MSGEPTRRAFVASTVSGLGGGWLWLQLPAVSLLASCARDAVRRGEPFSFFTEVEAATMRAFAARIVPSEHGLPGAEEAGAVWFADGALATFFSSMQQPVREGLADLDARAASAHRTLFASLEQAQQDGIIGAVTESTFFELGRLIVLAGVFSDPGYGGNRNGASARILGVQHEAAYQPPFGWYDGQLLVAGGAS
jgi:hypothetical protein